MIPAPEHPHAHHGHGTGLPWLDILVGVSAVFISVVSLVVSIQHGKTMEKMVEQNQKMVEASTMPILTLSSGQLDPANGKPLLRLMIRNSGVGPAIVDHFELRYKGQPYKSAKDLLKACCAGIKDTSLASGFYYGNLSGSILPARDSVDILGVRPPENDLGLYKTILEAQKDMDLRACYCSVTGECWQTDFERQRPESVQSCATGAKDVLW